MRNKVREARRRVGLTQVELAEQVGVTRQTIIRFEREGTSHTPSARVMFTLAKALSVPVSAHLRMIGGVVRVCAFR